MRRRLLSGSSWALGGKLGGSAVGIFTNALLTRVLSRDEFGTYALTLTIVTFGSIVGSLGLPKTVVRYVAENIGLNRFGRVRRSIYLILGLGLLGTLVSSLSYLLVFGDLVGKYVFHSQALVAVTGLTAGWLAITTVQEITAEAFRGFHDIRWATLLGGLATGGKSGGLIMRIILLGCIVLLWWTNGNMSLGTVILISIGSGSASLLLSFWLLRGRMSSLGQQQPGADEVPVTTREVLNDALPILVVALTAFILQSADVWIIGAFRTKAELGVYAATARLVAFIAMPLLVVNLVLPPLTSEMYAQGRMAELERTVRAFSTIAGVPSLLVLVVFMLFGGPILGFVYPDSYQSGVVVLVLLSFAKLVAVWSGSCGMVLQFTGHQSAMLRVSMWTSPLFIIGALLVVQDYGSVGVAGVAAAVTTLQNVWMVLVAKRKTGMWTHVMFLSPSTIRQALSKL